MREFIWTWLVLSLADVIIFFAQKSLNFKDCSMLFQNNAKNCQELLQSVYF